MKTYHFILTRFNLYIWNRDKNGKEINREEWLERRMKLFETFCLPSVKRQQSMAFTWIILVDAETPERYRKRILAYREECPQIAVIPVRREGSKQFAKVFREVTAKMLAEKGAKEGDTCLTTYLDNDDSLNSEYVATVQSMAGSLENDTPYFICFDYGLQHYTEHGVTTRIRYENNHFMTAVEKAGKMKTCFGFGSHFLLEKNAVAHVVHVTERERPMWIEVIHEENVDNDVKMTPDTHRVSDEEEVKRMFGVDVKCRSMASPAFMLRILKQIIRRAKGER